ncbi:hypothetical protein QAD02_018202 [Eretmocerus hayati]|uniref:Uncharacterized protein n=1 Tax=Eretmocerus hayati TaxID=131215 RepID=A0ACC2PKW3_9HYME|nr:hypothetical protein QAD02_018202 [Eretmocerus hayati]
MSLVVCAYFVIILTVQSQMILQPANEHIIEPRVVGGRKSAIRDYPYMVSLQVHNTHICGGSILSERMILTAAHCTEYFKSTLMKVEAGDTSLLYDNSRPRVINVIRHPQFSTSDVTKYDIALLKVDRNIGLDGRTKSAVKLVDKNYEVREGDDAVVAGWGATFSKLYSDTGEIPEYLFNHTDVEIEKKIVIETDESSKQIRVEKFLVTKRTGDLSVGHVSTYSKVNCISFSRIFDWNGHTCASGKKQDICNGDSGGPLMMGDYQVGIVSFSTSLDCSHEGNVVIYTDIAHYRDWIDKERKKLEGDEKPAHGT